MPEFGSIGRVGRACDRPADARLEGSLQEHSHNSLRRIALATVTSRAMRGQSYNPALVTYSIWSRSTALATGRGSLQMRSTTSVAIDAVRWRSRRDFVTQQSGVAACPKQIFSCAVGQRGFYFWRIVHEDCWVWMKRSWSSIARDDPGV